MVIREYLAERGRRRGGDKMRGEVRIEAVEKRERTTGRRKRREAFVNPGDELRVNTEIR
jgi:hypothetical protein